MGCSVFQDPLIDGILKKLESKAKSIIDTAIVKKGELEAKKALKIAERHNEFKSLFDKKEEITEDKIKEYNKEEFKCDEDLILNEIDKTEKLYMVGIDLADELRKGMIEKFTNQLSTVPSRGQAIIKAKIDQLTRFTPSQFLHSDFGKPLKKALVKYGASSEVLENYCKKLDDERSKRREAERIEFNLKENEQGEKLEFYLELIEKICKKLTGEEEE